MVSPNATVFWDSGMITEISESSLLAGLDERDGWDLDATGSLVLPGMVNLYDRSFESVHDHGAANQLRPSVDGRLRGHAAELAASGITTSFLSVGDTGTPKSRTPGNIREVADALQRGAERCVDLRLNVRHGAHGTEHVRELVDLIQHRTIGMLTYLHSPIGEPTSHEHAVREIGRLQARRLTTVAAAAHCVTASLGASTQEHLADDLELGIRVALLPGSIEMARGHAGADVRIVLDTDRPRRCEGAAGTVTGGLSVREALAEGLRPLLCSAGDHQSMLLAAFDFAQEIGDLPRAWAAVSRGPAIAAGLFDRGQLSPGHRADLLVVDPPAAGRPPELRARGFQGARGPLPTR